MAVIRITVYHCSSPVELSFSFGKGITEKNRKRGTGDKR